ncbi:MAG: response regulator, partial [Acidobacteriota bacterium]
GLGRIAAVVTWLEGNVAGQDEGVALTILVVEDELAIRELVRDVLQMAGYEALTAPNGEEALREAESYEKPIHLVLTDLIMPGMNGLALSRRLKARQPDIKVILMSGYGEERIDEVGGLQADMAVLEKPFTTTILLSKVRAMLER